MHQIEKTILDGTTIGLNVACHQLEKAMGYKLNFGAS